MAITYEPRQSLAQANTNKHIYYFSTEAKRSGETLGGAGWKCSVSHWEEEQRGNHGQPTNHAKHWPTQQRQEIVA